METTHQKEYIEKVHKRKQQISMEKQRKSSLSKYEESFDSEQDVELYDECDLEIYEILSSPPVSDELNEYYPCERCDCIPIYSVWNLDSYE